MVIKGGPGSGKSTLLDKIAYTWAMNVNSDNKKATFDYVFRIDLKKLETAKVKKG
jgi:predicted ATPase